MKKILIILALLLCPQLALAQSQRNPCYYTAANPGPGNGCIPVSTANPLPVTSSGSGTSNVTITDGTNGPVSVTPANTGPSAINPALVVSMSQNSAPLTVNQGLLAGSSANSWFIQGNVAGGVADTLNPVKIGGVFNSTLPTYITGQRTDLQLSNFGGVITATSATAADASTNVGGNLNIGTASSSNTAGALFNKPYIFNGTTWDRARGIAGAVAAGTGTAAVAIAPTSAASGGIIPVVTSAAANNLVIKGTPGNLYSVYAANVTATAGFLVVINATTAPADGAITPLDCAALPANGNASINYNPGPPSVYSTGIVAVVTSAANCFTKTTGTLTAFIKGAGQ